MRYVLWPLRAAVFLVLLGFAVKNDQPVVLHYFLGYQWRASLVVILLASFVVGIAVGMLVMFGSRLRQQRELADLRRQLQLKNQLADAAPAAGSSS